MKALALRQPWLWAVLELGKTIENRRWFTTYRGPILLHASKGCGVRECEDALAWMVERRLLEPHDPRWPGLENIERGGVCGYAEIDGVLFPDSDERAASTLASFRANDPNADEMLRWRMPDQHGFVLRNVRRLSFVPCLGALGFFEVPLDVGRGGDSNE